MWIFWAGVNTAIALGCGPNNHTKTQLKRWSQSSSKWTLVRLNGWTNDWMTLSTRVVLFTVSGSLAKRAVWKRTAPNKKNQHCIWTKASELADFPGVNTPLVTYLCILTIQYTLPFKRLGSVQFFEIHLSYCFLTAFYFLKCSLLLWCKAEFSASLFQSSVSHDPSEIIWICRFAAQETFLIIISVENIYFFHDSKEPHLLETEIVCSNINVFPVTID